jgi:peptidoglycan/LPS O-acetylase OafA/YrhL
MKYRPEIDGLRAVAVMPVMLFHAGFAPFRGGFVGVDVFFVISGYLITTLIASDLSAGRFSIVDFYERRARRIIPALFFIAMLCVPAAIALFPMSALRSFASALIATFLFGSNVWFWREVDYFNPETESNPLIHTWSLGVEEQFYFVFPLLMLACWRWGATRLLVLVGALIAASLIAAEAALRVSPQAAFYLLPFRAWELLLGSLAALVLLGGRAARGWLDDALACLGIACIAVPVVLYDESTPFPSVYALVPTIGAVLVVVFASPGTLAARLLASAPFRGIGLISYSAYLWHQPILAFYRVQDWTVPSAAGFAACVALTLGLAFLTWRFVEQPFRRPGHGLALRPIPAAAAASLAAIAVGAVVLRNAPALATWGLDAREIAILDYTSEESRQRHRALYLHSTCFLREDQRFSDLAPSCFSSAPPDRETVLWGDSHAASFYPALRPIFGDRLTYLTGGGCAPVLGLAGLRQSCRDLNARTLDYVDRRRPAQVIMPGRWARFAEQPEFAASLQATLERLLRAGVKDIVLLGPLPEWSPSNPELLVRGLRRSEARQDPVMRLEATGLDRLRSADQRLRTIARDAEAAVGRGGVRVMSTADVICTAGRCVGGLREGEDRLVPLAWDYGHLTPEGSRHIVERLPPLAHP